MSARIVVGIDPGRSGAIALVEHPRDRAPLLLTVFDMPLTSENEVDGKTLAEKLRLFGGDRAVLAVIEKVSGMSYVKTHADGRKEKRGQGSAASFAFGLSAGIARGVVEALGIPILLTPASVWKSAMGLCASKDVSRARAQAVFPEWGQSFARKKDDGRAEAALLGVFGRRLMR